jgi:hypothetical protein
MNDYDLVNLNASESVVPKNEERAQIVLTEQQIDTIIMASAKLAGDVGDIIKDVVAIWKIHAQGKAFAELHQIEIQRSNAAARADIERMMQREKEILTKGDVVIKIMGGVNQMLSNIPEIDNASRHALIDQLGSLVTSVIGGSNT